MANVIGVRFHTAGKIYYFLPGEQEVKQGEYVIVQTAQGVEMGEVIVPNKQVRDFKTEIKPIIRVANHKDHEHVLQNKEKCEKAFETINQQVRKHKLDMKVIDIEYTFDNSKIIFYFAAEQRVDFRELVKDLAGVFKTRIELRQIGVRDEAKLLGGIGPCGRAACCNVFLGDFSPVSIKMAKEQNLSLSPTKISGLCGRLMCCLNYEQELYEQARKQLPRVGNRVTTPDGDGEILDVKILSRTAKVKITLPDKTVEARFYSVDDLQWEKRRFKKDDRPGREEKNPEKNREEKVLPDQE